VTGVCSTTNVELVKSLGAYHVIDYTKEDFTKTGQTYDVIFDAVGKSSSSRNKKSLKKTGYYLSVKSSTSFKIKTEDLIFLKELIDAGKIKSVIDRRYFFEQIPQAHRYVEGNIKKGMWS
jgi:NADPH:quinone reductase-like Zn-dependent oxidoreductase